MVNTRNELMSRFLRNLKTNAKSRQMKCKPPERQENLCLAGTLGLFMLVYMRQLFNNYSPKWR